jgi:hypothetical protein
MGHDARISLTLFVALTTRSGGHSLGHPAELTAEG